MPASAYIQTLRRKIGHDLLMLPSATAMPFDGQGRLLLAKSPESGLWMTIGGAVDPDETPADAAVRECWEEAGLLVEITHLIGVFGGPEFEMVYPNGDRVYYVTTVFGAVPIGGEARPDGVETSDLRFVGRDEWPELPMTPMTRLMVEHSFGYEGRPCFARPTWRPAKE